MITNAGFYTSEQIAAGVVADMMDVRVFLLAEAPARGYYLGTPLGAQRHAVTNGMTARYVGRVAQLRDGTLAHQCPAIAVGAQIDCWDGASAIVGGTMTNVRMDGFIEGIQRNGLPFSAHAADCMPHGTVPLSLDLAIPACAGAYRMDGDADLVDLRAARQDVIDALLSEETRRAVIAQCQRDERWSSAEIAAALMSAAQAAGAAEPSLPHEAADRLYRFHQLRAAMVRQYGVLREEIHDAHHD